MSLKMRGDILEVTSGYKGTTVEKVEGTDGQCVVWALQGNERARGHWGPVLDGWGAEYRCWGAGREAAGEGGRSQFMKGLITRPLDLIWKSTESHSRI